MKNVQNYSQMVAADVVFEGNNIVSEGSIILYGTIIGSGSVIGRVPRKSVAVVGDKSTSQPTELAENCVISSNVTIYTGVKIGTECLIGDNTSILCNVVIGERVLISRNVTINSEVVIGSDSRIMDNSHVTSRSQIGDHVFMSVGISSANDNLFGKHGLSEAVSGFTLEDFVSVGAGCIILPGSIVGKGSIVAAGSVLKGEYPGDSIISGNPAKVVTRVPRHMMRYDRE
jgi:acetyltransferase-like isoleucine patch superfamily enzyme